MTDPIPLSLHPSLEVFAREWLGLDPWAPTLDSRGEKWQHYIEGKHQGSCIPLHVPAGRSLLGAWLAAQGHDCRWTFGRPEALRRCVELVARGEEPLRGVFGPWVQDRRGNWTRHRSPEMKARHFSPPIVWAPGNTHGWSWGRLMGPEPGDEAKAIVDAHLREQGYWLADS